MESFQAQEGQNAEDDGFGSMAFNRSCSVTVALRSRCEELRLQPTLKSNPALRRAASARAVLAGFGRVFAAHEVKVANAAITDEGLEAAHLARLAEGEEEEGRHRVEDEAFYGVPEVEQIGVFISHSWSAPRWQKALAMYYYMNVQLAVVSSVLTWIGLMASMVLLYGPTGLGGEDLLLPLFVGVPMAVFFLAFFCGHHVWTPVADLWLDRLCIHQSRPALKATGIRALPEIVAGSGRMLVLWSDTYFERIWCNAELATFSAVKAGAAEMDFLPLWFVPWLLSSMTLDVVGVFISNRLFVLIPEAGELFAARLPDCASWVISFLAQFTGIGLAFSAGYLCVALPTWHSFCIKLDIHRDMLQQCRSYTLQSAKCSVESDRPIVEELVRDLFLHHRDPVAAFERFMHRGLCAHIEARLGRPQFMPYRICLLVFLPLTFSAAANVWGCDGMPCADAAEAELGKGAPVAQQMATNALAWAVGILGIYPTVCPATLSLLAWRRRRLGGGCGGSFLRGLLDVLLVCAGYAYMGFHEGLAAGLINTASAQASLGAARGVPWCCAVLVYLSLLAWWNVYLFDGYDKWISPFLVRR